MPKKSVRDTKAASQKAVKADKSVSKINEKKKIEEKPATEIGKKRARPVTDSQIDIVKPGPVRKSKILSDGSEQIIEIESKKVP